jgi:hypothetical protein
MRSTNDKQGVANAPLQPSPVEPAPLEPSLTDEEAARVIGVAVKTMRNWRSKGLGPPWVAVGRKLVRYRPSDLRAFQEANLRRSTSQARTNDLSETRSKSIETTEDRSRKISGVEVDHEQ